MYTNDKLKVKFEKLAILAMNLQRPVFTLPCENTQNVNFSESISTILKERSSMILLFRFTEMRTIVNQTSTSNEIRKECSRNFPHLIPVYSTLYVCMILLPHLFADDFINKKCNDFFLSCALITIHLHNNYGFVKLCCILLCKTSSN